MSDRPAHLMRDREIAPFTRVRMRQGRRLISGWHGKATMMPNGSAIKDGFTDPRVGGADACDYEWVVLRDQTPNPEHPQTEDEWRRRYTADDW